MSVTYGEQYRTIRTTDADAMAPVSISTVHQLCENINTLKLVTAPRVWDVAAPGRVLQSLDADTNENIVRVYGPFQRHSGFDKWTWTIVHHQMDAAAGGSMTDDTIWRVYSTGQPPPYSTVLDTSQLGDYDSDQTGVTTSSGTPAIGVRDKQLNIVAKQGVTYLILTAENDGTSGTSTVLTFDAVMRVNAA